MTRRGLKFSATIICLSMLATSVVTPAPAQNAKGLYREQLEKPASKANTGFSFWIELRRAGAPMKRVDTRFAFKSGDKVRIHMKPNIDGHAHVVLMRGSTGKQAVLFPTAKDSGNTVVHGKDYILPPTTFLVFDNNKGTEMIRVALSRNDIKAASLLNPEAGINIAKIGQTSNFVQPKNILVSFSDASAPATTQTTQAPPAIQPTEQMPENNDMGGSKDLFREDCAPPPPRPAAPKKVVTATPAHKHATKPVAKKNSGLRPVSTPIFIPETTVVNTDPADTLYAEIILAHN
jgi:hypothetical protein